MYLIMKSSVDKIGSCGAECHGIIIKTKTCVAKLWVNYEVLVKFLVFGNPLWLDKFTIFNYYSSSKIIKYCNYKFQQGSKMDSNPDRLKQ